MSLSQELYSASSGLVTLLGHLQEVRIDHRGLEVAVSEQELNCPDVRPKREPLRRCCCRPKFDQMEAILPKYA
jgi:hypothetical protein